LSVLGLAATVGFPALPATAAGSWSISGVQYLETILINYGSIAYGFNDHGIIAGAQMIAGAPVPGYWSKEDEYSTFSALALPGTGIGSVENRGVVVDVTNAGVFCGAVHSPEGGDPVAFWPTADSACMEVGEGIPYGSNNNGLIGGSTSTGAGGYWDIENGNQFTSVGSPSSIVFSINNSNEMLYLGNSDGIFYRDAVGREVLLGQFGGNTQKGNTINDSGFIVLAPASGTATLMTSNDGWETQDAVDVVTLLTGADLAFNSLWLVLDLNNNDELLCLATFNNTQGFYIVKFDYTAAAVPEPAAWAGLAGLMVLAWVATRRFRAARVRAA
jgi:hypothetical protein